MCAGTWGAVVFLDTCVILCTVFSTGAVQQRQVKAQVGQSVNMQCVVPVPNITQWGTLRLFLQKDVPPSNPKVVFSFSDAREQPDHQDLAYKNRCRLTKENITLSLSQVSPSDEGVYDCKIFLKKAWGHELVYTGQLVLSIWANYTKPQMIFRRSFDAGHIAVCSSNGGFPKGDVKWILSSNNIDIRNMTETWSDKNLQTLMYNISGRLTLPLSATGWIYCCVVATGQRVCSDETELPHPEKPRNGKDETRRNTVLICLSLMIALTLSMLQPADVHLYAGGAQ